MNRNIITKAEADQQRQRVLLEGEKGVRETGTQAQTLTADAWHDKLLKYIPVEAVALYLALDGVIRSVDAEVSARRLYFGFILLVALVFCAIHLKQVAKVSRNSQIAISLVALVVWVFAMGGFFATYAFYQAWQGTVLVIISAAFLGFFDPPGQSIPASNTPDYDATLTPSARTRDLSS